MAKTQEEMEELTRKYAGGAEAYPLGQGPTTDLMPPEPVASPALAPGGNGQASNAPATAQPNGPQAGAGGTSAQQALLEKTDPKMSVESAEQSMQAISGKSGETAKAGEQAVQQKKQINDALAAQGVQPRQAFEKLYEGELAKIDKRYESGEITKRQHKGWKNRWKNIFNTVPEEDFGLFMMDFGLRMMQASGQGETLGASIGMAGQGALAGAQGRQQLKQQQSMEREQMATQRALSRSGLEQRQTRDAQIESTTGGLIERGPDGTWRPIIDPETGKPYKRDLASDRPYRGKEVYMEEFLRGAGFSDQEIANRLAGGVPRDVAAQEYMSQLMKMRSDASYTEQIPQPDGSMVKLREATPSQMRAYVDMMLDQVYQGQRQGPALQ